MELNQTYSGGDHPRKRFVFKAMACQCEVLLTTTDVQFEAKLNHLALQEVTRIEKKYSRYRADSALSKINARAGYWTTIDTETEALLSFADKAFNLSNEQFDVTSGLLRKAWTFDGSENLPNQKEIDKLLPFIGFFKVGRRTEEGQPQIRLLPGMELDFGGFVKEYAADVVLMHLNRACESNIPILINLGGDIATNGALFSHDEWRIGVQSKGKDLTLKLQNGALATSGDEHRFLIKNGVKYSHILNPKTGWPVSGAPSAVTVAANTCLEAGLLSTVALLNGDRAEVFLKSQQRSYWIVK